MIVGICQDNNPTWNVRRIENEILRLKYHNGYPSGNSVHDPVLLQDKFNYLAAVKDNVLPTLKIPLKSGDCKDISTHVRK